MLLLRAFTAASFVITLAAVNQQNDQLIDKYFASAISSKLARCVSAAAQIREASRTWSYSPLADSNGISHYIYVRKIAKNLFDFVKAVHRQFEANDNWKIALIDAAQFVNLLTNLMTDLQTRITDERFLHFGFSTAQIFNLYENMLEILDLSKQLEDRLLRESLLSDLNIAFNSIQLIVEQTEKYAPVIRANMDSLTIYCEKHSRMLSHQRGCARANGRLIPSKLDDQEVVLVADPNATALSWNNLVYYGQRVALLNPKSENFLTNADFDCYGTMSWDRGRPESSAEYFRILHPDLRVTLARPIRIGDRVVIQSERDNAFICSVNEQGSTQLLVSPKSCEFQLRFRNSQIPQI